MSWGGALPPFSATAFQRQPLLCACVHAFLSCIRVSHVWSLVCLLLLAVMKMNATLVWGALMGLLSGHLVRWLHHGGDDYWKDPVQRQ